MFLRLCEMYAYAITALFVKNLKSISFPGVMLCNHAGFSFHPGLLSFLYPKSLSPVFRKFCWRAYKIYKLLFLRFQAVASGNL